MRAIRKTLNEVAEAEGGYKYLPAGNHKLRLKNYEWKDGTGYTETIGPLFTFIVLASDNPTKCVPGSTLSRLIKLNVEGKDESKRRSARGRRKDECVDVFRALFVSKDQLEATDPLTFNELIEPDEEAAAEYKKAGKDPADAPGLIELTDKVNAVLEAAECYCFGEDVQANGQTFTNVTFSPPTE